MSRKKFVTVVFIILIAAATRLLFLGQFPNGFTGDEAEQGYSAYSILKTGRDEWGQFIPIFPRGFGDYKPPLNTYLIVPSVAIFGLTVEGVRIPAAVTGVLSVGVVYFLTRELLKDEKVALWSAFFLAINPWHIQLSRTAWEGGIGILTFSLGLIFYLKSGFRNLMLSSVFWGLTLYSYHSWRVFTVFFILGLILLNWNKITSKSYLIAGLIFLIFSAPLSLNINSVLARSSDVGIFGSQQLSAYFSNKGVTPLPPLLDKIMDNKLGFTASQFFNNYLSYYSPGFYFTDNRPDNTYLNFPYFPLLYPLELILWLVAIFVLIRQKIVNKNLIILWFVLASVPAALAAGSSSANRAPTLLPLISIISALGINFITSKWKNAEKIMLAVLFLSFTGFLYFYFFKLPQKPVDNLRYGYDQIFKKVVESRNQYSQIVISKVFTEPQIFIAFYSKMDPSEFQQASVNWLRYETAGKHYLDQLESWNLGNYLFEDINWAKKDSLRKDALIISKPEDFPSGAVSVFDFRDPKGKVIYRMVPVKNEEKI